MHETAGKSFAVCLNSRRFAWNKLHITQRTETSSIIKPMKFTLPLYQIDLTVPLIGSSLVQTAQLPSEL